MKIAKDNIILIAIGLLIVLSVFKKQTVTIEGYTSKDVEYLLKIKDLENDKKILNYEIEIFKEELIKDSVFVHNATPKQIDSLFTEYFNGQP